MSLINAEALSRRKKIPLNIKLKKITCKVHVRAYTWHGAFA